VKGLVMSAHGRTLRVLAGEEEVKATLAGRTFLGDPPAAGDFVEVRLCEDGINTVAEILPRRNSLHRPCPGGIQVIAANLDAVIVLVSLRSPAMKRGFIDRAAAAAFHEGIPVSIVVNKVDLAEPDDLAELESAGADYREAGIPMLCVSCLSGSGVPALAASLTGMTVALTGPSGAGKTSLVKALGGPSGLRTGALSARTGKGVHTTVASVLIRLPGGVTLVDTPGLRAFPVSHIPLHSTQLCFPEFERFRHLCRFRNCLHRDEPGCAVAAAVREGTLSAPRYDSYTQLLAEASGG